jgi:hypothetical protein
MSVQSLLYGLGVTRSGSTWLHATLRAHPQVHLRAVKEAHWFDTLENDSIEQRLAVLRAKQKHLSERGGRARRLAAVTGLMAAFENGAQDADYIAWLCDRASSTARVFCDITPAYATLPEQRLHQMQGMGVPAKFLVVLRDPLTRLLSHVQFVVGRSTRSDADMPGKANAMLRSFLNDDAAGLHKRSDYAAMFARFDRAIPAKMLMVLFFEQLFAPGALDRLTGWLGVDPLNPAQPVPVNASPRISMDEDLVAQVHAKLAPQYEFARTRFGAELPAGWRAPQWQEV